MTSKVQSTLRRKFFLSAAAFATWTLLAKRAPAQSAPVANDAPSAVGLGFSLYGMRSLSLSTALQAVAEIGYDCVELPIMPDWPADSAKFRSEPRRALREELAMRGLRLTALMENLPVLGDEAQHRSNLERLKRAGDMAIELAPEQPTVGKPKVPLIETILGGKPGEFEQVKQRLVARLRDCADVLADAQVVLAVKAHVGNAVQRPQQLSWLLAEVASPWLHAAYDYSHFELQGLEMKDTINSLLPRTAFIHVKDTEHAQGRRGFLLPGDGTIDYVKMFRQLGQSSYRGDVVVEVSSQISSQPGYDPLTAARRCYNHLAGAFSEASLPRG